jgi:hypothetical protein
LNLRPESIIRLSELRESINDPATIPKRDHSRIRIAQIGQRGYRIRLP